MKGAAACLALALTLVACSSQHADLIVVGDSISVISEDSIKGAFGGIDVEVDAEAGAHIADMRDAIDKAIRARPQALVIELGTNDLSEPTADVQAEVTAILDAANAIPCVRWVTVVLPGDAATAFNDHLRDEDAQRENVGLVDWAGVAGGHAEWFEPDGVHPNQAGALVLAKAISDSLKGCVPSG